MTSILTLALGIGANAVVFSVMNALVLRPAQAPNWQSLYMIERGSNASFQSYLDYRDLRERNRSFTALAAYYVMGPAGFDTGGDPATVWPYETSGNYFDALGIQPYLGRFFHDGDVHAANSAPYVVLSYAYWHSRFHDDRSAVGRQVEINKHLLTIVGIAPPGFRGTELFFAPDMWVPLVEQPTIEGWDGIEQRSARFVSIVGRLNAGVTPAQALSDLNGTAAYLAKAYSKDDEGETFSLARPGLFGDLLGRPARAFMSGLMLLAGLILVAACANLGILFAARAADRSREFALRMALGSHRKLIVRLMLGESVIVSLLGGGAGLLVAVLSLRWLSAWYPVSEAPFNVPVNPDIRTYLLALVVSLASGIVFGLVPIRQVLRTDPLKIIRSGDNGFTGLRRFSMRDILLTLQIAICAVLVTSSLVAIRGLERSVQSNFGFEPRHAMLVETHLNMAGYSGETAAAMQRRIRDAVAALPGVTGVAYTDRIPLGLNWHDVAVFADGTADYRQSNTVADAEQFGVSAGYFDVARTRLLAGRTPTADDDSRTPLVAVVNREFARKVFGSVANAVGAHCKVWPGTRLQVVGVVEDGKYKTITEDPRPAIFFPILQQPSTDTVLIVRSDRDPQDIAGALQQTMKTLDPSLPFRIRTWNRDLDWALLVARSSTVALVVLGSLGFMVALTGIFGMTSYAASKRMREFGIRVALGARKNGVLSAALGRALQLLSVGSVLGVTLAWAATRVLSSIVYQATPEDPLVVVGVIGTMLLLGLASTWIPARRALAVDPIVLLRDQ